MPSCVSPVELVAQRFAVDERHHVVQERIGLARIEQRENVRVLEIGRGLDFLDEPLGAKDGGKFGTENFHRDRAVVFQIVGEVDVRHATFAQVAFDLVAVGEGGGEPGGVLGHRLSSRTLPAASGSGGRRAAGPKPDRSEAAEQK